MGLSERLRRLRPEGGVPDQVPRPGGLEERLRRLRIGAGPRADGSTGDAEQRLAARLGAERLEPGLLMIRRRFPLNLRHGSVPLARLLEPISALPDSSAGGDPSGYLFLDTETTGLSGGTGTLAFLVGIARLEGDALLITQYLLTRFGPEPGLLREIRSSWESDVILVTFNGKSFDLPLLATRCRLAGVGGPQPGQRHIDLLPLTRRAFASRWPACSLAQAELRLLGFRRVNDLPGAEAPSAWQDFLRRGSIRPLEGVVRHNRSDLISLAALLPALERVFREPWRSGADSLSLARAYLARGREQEAIELLRRNRESRRDAEADLLLARLFRRQRRWADALVIWQHWAIDNNSEALECLAKYHEHHTRCLTTALSFAERLAAFPGGSRRERRIRRKLESGVQEPTAGQPR